MGAEETYKKLLIEQNVPAVVGAEIRKDSLRIPHRSLLNLNKLDFMKREASFSREASQGENKKKEQILLLITFIGKGCFESQMCENFHLKVKKFMFFLHNMT